MPKGLVWAGVGSPPTLGLSGDHTCGWRQLGIAGRMGKAEGQGHVPWGISTFKRKSGGWEPTGETETEWAMWEESLRSGQ